jgi:hypothetical protein
MNCNSPENITVHEGGKQKPVRGRHISPTYRFRLKAFPAKFFYICFEEILTT